MKKRDDAQKKSAATEEASTTGDGETPVGSSPTIPSSSTGSNQRVLDPSSLWFDDNSVKRDVTNAIQGYFVAPWKNYSVVDSDTKEHWFTVFGHKYSWRAELESAVRKAFQACATDRVRQMIYRVIHVNKGKKPRWLTADVHKEILKIPSTDEAYIARSMQNKQNRRGGSMDNPVEPTHFQGSISSAQHAKKLAIQNGGKLPTPADVFLHTHFKKVEGQGKVAANNRAKKIADAYEHIQQTQTSSEGTKRSAAELFFEATGGRNKKGRVRGLGRGADLYYGSSTSCRGSGSSSQFTPSLMAQMKDQLREEFRDEYKDEITREVIEEVTIVVRSEMQQEVQSELELQRTELQKTNRQWVDEIMTRFSGMNMPNSCSGLPPYPRDPRNDDPGSGGAGQGLGALV